MNYNEGGLSASDVALLTGNRNNNDDFGNGSGSWWIIIFLIFAFMGGWGRNGFGNGANSGDNGNDRGVMDAYVLNSDFATLQRQIDSGFNTVGNRIESVNNGLCQGFYQQAQLVNGLENTLCTQFGNVQNAITQNGYEGRLGVQNLASQMQNCCCDVRQQISDTSCATQRAIDGVNYNNLLNNNTTNNNITAGFNNIQNSMCLNTRDIVEAQNNGTRAILDAITQNRIEDKNAQIQAQQNEIQALRLSASQQAQNNYLVNQLRPCPVPAYLSCNPNQSIPVNYVNAYSGNGCGCGCN